MMLLEQKINVLDKMDGQGTTTRDNEKFFCNCNKFRLNKV